MTIHQLSLFLENKPRHLRVPIRALAEARINILAMSLADTKDFGVLRLIVKDWAHARDVLEAAGCVVNISEVIAVEVPDRPGGLDAVMAVLEQAGLDVEYIYSFTSQRKGKAVLVLRFEEPRRACQLLEACRIGVVTCLDDFDQAGA